MLEAKITDEEKEKCRKVADAFRELYDLYGDMYVVDAGPFGFVHLRWYGDEEFQGNSVYTDSEDLFSDLWEYWLEYHLLEPVKGTPLAELSYEELYELLSEEQKDYYAKKKREFLKIAEMENILRLV